MLFRTIQNPDFRSPLYLLTSPYQVFQSSDSRVKEFPGLCRADSYNSGQKINDGRRLILSNGVQLSQLSRRQKFVDFFGDFFADSIKFSGLEKSNKHMRTWTGGVNRVFTREWGHFPPTLPVFKKCDFEGLSSVAFVYSRVISVFSLFL